MEGRGSWGDDLTERRSARVSKRRYHTETIDSADHRRSIHFLARFNFPLSADSASSPDRFSDAELVAFLDEQLEPSRSSEIEQACARRRKTASAADPIARPRCCRIAHNWCDLASSAAVVSGPIDAAGVRRQPAGRGDGGLRFVSFD